MHGLELGRDDRLEIRLKHRTENIGGRAVLQLDLKPAVAFELYLVQEMGPGRWHMLERTRVAPHPTDSHESMRDMYCRHLAHFRAGS